MIRDLSQHYQVFTPYLVPLKFCDNFYRLAAQCKCVVCGNKQLIEIVRCHPIYEKSMVLGKLVMSPRPNPEDQKIIGTFMVNAANHGCGCTNKDNFYTDSVGILQPRLYDFFKTKTDRCIHPLGQECPLCESCAMPVKWLRYAPHLHTRECPVGKMKRTGPFALSGMQMTAGLRK